MTYSRKKERQRPHLVVRQTQFSFPVRCANCRVHLSETGIAIHIQLNGTHHLGNL